MAKTDFTSVNEYLASQPEAARRVLARVRSTIRKAVRVRAAHVASGGPFGTTIRVRSVG